MRWSKIVGILAVLTLGLAMFGGCARIMEARALGGARWLEKIDASDFILVPIVIAQAAIIWRCLFKRGLD